MGVPQFKVEPVSRRLLPELRRKMASKTKPVGSLGILEELAARVGCIQGSTSPRLRRPTLVLFAGDHGIAATGQVNAYPREVTAQMVKNILGGGAAVNCFARLHGFELRVVNAGVAADMSAHPDLVNARIAPGTRDYRHGPAMMIEQCERALEGGAEVTEAVATSGCNVIGFGEMGIGNSSSASLIAASLSGLPLEQCVGRGAGQDEAGLARKRAVLAAVLEKHGVLSDPLEALAAFGGFEMAMLCGGVLEAARRRMLVLVDGFIVTAGVLAAWRFCPAVLDYCVFCHESAEEGHGRLLRFLGVEPLLELGMRLGEGTGAVLAYPLVRAAVASLNEMASFESAGVSRGGGAAPGEAG